MTHHISPSRIRILLTVAASILMLLVLLTAAGTAQAESGPLAGSIGNFVWHDLDLDGLQDGGEPGIDGVVVQLLNAAGTTVLQSANTAGGGFYSFGGLAADTYRVRIAASNFSPAGVLYQYGLTSAAFYGPNPSVITLGADQNFETADFGYAKASMSLTKTVSLNGVCPGVSSAPVLPGAQVTYCYSVTNTGDTWLTNVTIDDNQLGLNVCTFVDADADGKLDPGESGGCQSAPAALNNSTCNIGTATATATDSKPNVLPDFAPAITESDEICVEVVNLRISITPGTDTNAVNAPHTFTVKVEQKIGSGAWTPVQGVNPVVTVSPAPSSKTDNCASTGTNAAGECTVVINSTSATVYTASASVTHTVGGLSITRTTGDAANTAAGGSGTATKTYVDLRISITPGTDTNAVNQAHTFTVKVEEKIGNGAWTAKANVNPTVSVSPTPSSTTNNTCAAPGTNASGQCTVTIDSTTATVYTASASVTATVSGQSITRQTGTAANTAAGGSGNATKTYVDLRISITPGTATNAVNAPHTFTVKVEEKIGNGAWTAKQGVSPAVTVSPAPSSKTDNCVAPGATNASGQCTVVINSTTATVYTASASVTATVSGQSITRATGDAANTAAGGTGNATKTYVDLRISISPLTDTNAANQAHTFTVLVEEKIGNGAWTAKQGVSPVVTVSPTPSSKTDNCAAPNVTNTSGQCTVVINSTSATAYTASASVTALVSGQSITRATGDAANTAAGGSGTATKTYVDLRISITPGTDTNAVNQAHTFTVKVEEKIGNGAWTAKQGVSPAVTVSPTPSSITNNCAAPGVTNASGECTVVINSTTATVYTASASVTATVSGQSITRQTGTAANTAAGGSGNATKTYVDLRISITPGTATNAVNASHTFTVKVEEKIGNGAWTAKQGVSPVVTVSPAPSSKTDNCVAPGVTNASGECTVVINSTTATVYTASASVTVSVSGQSITRATGDPANAAAGGTGNATKTYVAAQIGDYVWEDVNGNGIQDETPASGLNGVTVELYTSGGVLFDTKVTANDGGGNPGYYLFENVPPGSYYVKFYPPTGYVFTVQGPTGSKDPTDSDPDRTTGTTETFAVVANETDLSWDAGMYRPATLGDQTWIDTNGNSTPDNAELLLNGVILQITGPDGTLPLVTTGGATFVPDGNYLSQNLRPGTYTVTVQSWPAGYVPSGVTQITHTLVSGETNLTFDFPFINTTGVSLLSISAVRDAQRGVTLVNWATLEGGSAEGYYVLRSASSDGVYERISDLISSQAPAGGNANYSYADSTVDADTAYWYTIELAPDGVLFGPVGDNGGRAIRKLFMPAVVR